MRDGVRDDRGSTVVELALLLPFLVALVIGTVEFGRGWQVQSSVSAAAREAVRVMAIQNDPAAARARALTAGGVTPALTSAQVTVSPASCTPGALATVTITYPLHYLTGFFPGSPTLTGKGVMRCGG